MDAISYHCPSCSADLKFNPTTGSFVCTYCDSVFTSADLEDQSQQGNAPAQGDTAQLMECHCANCGAQVITGDTTVATECYYCHSAVILKSRLTDGTLPQRIVPFKFDKAQAQETFRKWAHRKNFIPKEFGNEENIQGVYFPYWLVDVDGEVSYTGTEFHIEDRPFLTGLRRYRVEYDIAKKGQIHMEDIALSALKQSRKELLEGIQPFHQEGMEPFRMAYLAGFQAEEKDMDEDESGTPAVKAMMADYAKAKLRETFTRHGRHVKKTFDFTPQAVHWEYSLMPVCLLILVFWGVPLFAAALRQLLRLFLPVMLVSFITAALIAVPLGAAVARVTYCNVLRLYERKIPSAPYTYKDMTQLVLTQDEKTYVKKKIVGEKARA